MRQRALFTLRCLAAGYLGLLVSLMFWAHSPRIMGWEPRVVVTGSMAPAVRPGDIGLIGPARPGPRDLPAGRVVLIHTPERETGYTLHRLSRYDENGMLITKGDANRDPDAAPVPIDHIRGQLRLVVPMVGLPVVWLRNQEYGPLALTALLTLGALTLLDGAVPARRVPVSVIG